MKSRKTKRGWKIAYIRYLKATIPRPEDFSEEFYHQWLRYRAKKDLGW